MAQSAARSRLFEQLSRRRSTSPGNEEYATADSFDLSDDAVLHSTVQYADNTTEQPLPQRQDHFPQEPSEDGTKGSMDMSIEVGRGMNKSTRRDRDDVSSDFVLALRDDSLYEIASTPPAKVRDVFTNGGIDLRREASVRKATQAVKKQSAAKASHATSKQRSIAEALGRPVALRVSDEEGTQPPRNTRFTKPRVTSTSQQGPRPSLNQTVQSTYTANSFLLPDLPDITELVSGSRKDGTPVFSRAIKSQSRFMTNVSRPLRPEHVPVATMAIPDEEKAIYASLQLLQEKNSKLEAEKTEVNDRAEQLEAELIDLRSQLHVAMRRPDSGFGSGEEGIGADHRSRLLASQKALQERLDRCYRELDRVKAECERATEERDRLITQAGVAYYNIEELKIENGALKETSDALQTENERLRAELSALYDQLRRRQPPAEAFAQTTGTAEPKPELRPKRTRRKSSTEQGDIATRIAREVQKHRESAAAVRGEASQPKHGTRNRSQSRRRSSAGFDAASRANDTAMSNITGHNTTGRGTVFEDTQQSRRATGNFSAQGPRSFSHHRAESRDLTELSAIDPNDVAMLRKKLEEELIAARSKRHSSAPVHSLPRKSSMKDLTIPLDHLTATLADGMTKTVRVQSPHTSDASVPEQQRDQDTKDLSVVSNTSRRRRRASAEGMTSAFIVPDITIDASVLGAVGANGVHHESSGCTVCHRDAEDMTVPTPVPVDERQVQDDTDLTSATIRPAQSAPIALATVIKQLEDEVVHLKLQLDAQHRLYSRHDPALSKRRRIMVRAKMEHLTLEIEKRSDQIYALHDALLGQRQAAEDAQARGEPARQMDPEQIEETLTSIGMDPSEVSGRIGRRQSTTLNEADDASSDESDELPWEGLSDYEDEGIQDA